IGEDARASCLVERIELQFQILVPGRDSGVSNPHRLEVLPSTSNSRYSYRRGRNEKNESRMVFEKLKAAFLEHLKHDRIIYRKVGFARGCPHIHREAVYLDAARRPAGLPDQRAASCGHPRSCGERRL